MYTADAKNNTADPGYPG